MLVNSNKTFQQVLEPSSVKQNKHTPVNGWGKKPMVKHVGVSVSHFNRAYKINIIEESINWLEYMQEKEFLKIPDSDGHYQIQHYFRNGEKRFIDNDSVFYVDGYAENDDGSESWILEFLGCFYHYCENCQTNLDKKELDEKRER